MPYCESCGAPINGQFCTKCGARAGNAGDPSPQPQSTPRGAGPVSIPSGPPPGAPVAKKRSPLVWILAGCFGLIVIAGVIVVATGYFFVYKAKQAGFDPALMQKNPGLAVAKILASTNPDIEVLSVDDNRGIIKVREKKSGKTLTMNLEDVKNGKIVFLDDQNKKVEIQAHGEGDSASVEVRSAEGTMKMGAGAVQLPAWMPAYPGAEGAGTFGLSSTEGKAGNYTFKTKDSPEKVAAFYEDALKNGGFEIERTSNQVAGEDSMIILVAKDSDSKRTAQVMATRAGVGTTVSLTFESKE